MRDRPHGRVADQPPDGVSASVPGWSDAPGPTGYDFDAIPPEERAVARLWARALTAPERDFISFDGRTYYTYGEFDRVVSGWISALAALGVRAGDRVAVMLPNCPDHVGLFIGAASIGVVVVPVNTAYVDEMLRHVLADSEAVVLVVDAADAARVSKHWQLPGLRHIVLAGTGDGPTERAELSDVPVHRFPDLSPRTAPDGGRGRPVGTTGPRSVASVLYTSGTTGVSKGVIIPNELYVHFAWGFSHSMGYTADDVLYTALPLFHVNPLAVTIIPAILTGARAIVSPRFSASKFWTEISETRATHFSAIGAIGNILLKRPESEFRSNHSLRLCQMVPAPLDVAEFESRFGVPVTYSMYGMTEGQFVLPSRDGTYRPGLIGRAHPHHQIQVHDDAGNEVAPGEIGELVVRPLRPGVMFDGYLGRPEYTLERLRGLWFHTGDLGRRDDAGDLWYVGRKADAIRRRGENVSAFEVEREALGCASVADAAAVAVPSELGEDDILLCVTAQPGESIEPAELHRIMKQVLPDFMVSRYIDVWDELPKNDSMRVLKRELAAGGLRGSAWDSRAEEVRPR